jgi:hypothetical protein
VDVKKNDYLCLNQRHVNKDINQASYIMNNAFYQRNSVDSNVT